MSELSEVFYTFLITSTIGMVLGIGRMFYKSKCKEVSLCCIKIIRDTEIEEIADERGNLRRAESNNNI